MFFNKFVKGGTAIQCLSQLELDSTKFKGKKFIGTNGIDIPQRRKQVFHKDKIQFTYIGRLDPYHKGLDLMIQAIAIKKDFLIANKCEFALYGPDRFGWGDQLRKLITENSIREIVQLKPAVSGVEKENILLDSDVFIQTSRFEGMPMGILEALSYGVPVLVTKGTTLGEITAQYDAGWAADTSAQSVSEEIEKVVRQNTLLQDKGQHALNLVKENFGWSKISNGTVEKYKLLFNQK